MDLGQRLVIFDCDGVLVDSEVLVIEIEAELLQAAGVPMTAADIAATCVGLSDDEMHRRIEERWHIELPPDFASQKRARIVDAFRADLRAVDGVAQLLDDLVAPRCVASSSALARVRSSLRLTGLDHHFEPYLFSAEMVAHGKPAPDLFLHAATAMGAQPDRAIVIEDSPHGVAAGRAASMTVLGFTGGSHCAPDLGDRLRHAGAHDVASDARELRCLLDDLKRSA